MNIHQKQKVEELKIEFIKKVESLITSGSARESFLNVYQDKNQHVYVMLNYPYDIDDYYRLRWTIEWYYISQDGNIKQVNYSSSYIENSDKLEQYTYSYFSNE